MAICSFPQVIIPANGAALPDKGTIPVLVIPIFTKTPVMELIKIILTHIWLIAGVNIFPFLANKHQPNQEYKET